MDQGFVTGQQLEAIAANALASHAGPFLRHAALMRYDRAYDPETEAADDRVMALAFDMLATVGHERIPAFDDACLVRRRLKSLGETDATIDGVASSYEAARQTAIFEAGPGAKRHLAEAGVPDDPANRMLAYDVLVRARAIALRQRAESRFETQLPPTPIVASASPDVDVPGWDNDDPPAWGEAEPSANERDGAESGRPEAWSLDESDAATLDRGADGLIESMSALRDAVDDLRSARTNTGTGRATERIEGRPAPVASFGNEIDAYVAMKLKSGRWRARKHGVHGTASAAKGASTTPMSQAKPARNHAKATLEVFVDFLAMKGIEFAHQVDQALVADFVAELNALPTHYRRSSALRDLPLAELIERTRDDPTAKRGLNPKTTRRHIGDVDQFWTYLKGQGRAVQPIDFAAVKPPKPRTLPADEATKWTRSQLQRFLHGPMFTGCVAPDRRGEVGSVVIRDGAFFVPLLALLMGLRREEAAALQTDDIGFDGPIPVVHVRENIVRDLKTLKSKRTVPMHRELVRLGLVELASKRRKARQRLLFPELVAAPSTALGDCVYDTLTSVFGPVSDDETSALIPRPIHGLRHWCNVAMKDARVSSEIRDDILGKRGMKETEDRYSRAATVENMNEDLHKAECMTDHIPTWRRSELV